MRRAEENENNAGVQEKKPSRFEGPSPAIHPPRSKACMAEHRGPWQHAREQYRNKVPPRRGAVMDFGEKAVEMLVNEKEVRKLGIDSGYREGPRQHDRQHEPDAGDGIQTLPR